VPPIYRFGFQFFAVFAAAMVVAFWPSYFSRLAAQPSHHPHVHGITMALWVALLVTQAWLIQRGRRPLHRRLGLIAFVLVPALAFGAASFLHFRVRDLDVMPPEALYFIALVVNALVACVVLVGLGLWYRKQPAVHARYMIASVLPLVTPVTDRLIARFAPSVASMVPRIGGSAVLPVAGFLLADAILIGLSVWDWRANRRSVFPVALVVLVAYHLSVLTFHRLSFWETFGVWFARLPLS
jgi:uncharacterized membrane protein YozB (DUF420 family)